MAQSWGSTYLVVNFPFCQGYFHGDWPDYSFWVAIFGHITSALDSNEKYSSFFLCGST